MRESDEIDYGIMGPDIILYSYNIHYCLGLLLIRCGRKEEGVESLLTAWDKRVPHDVVRANEIKKAFLVPMLKY
jgi:hypothetical protein